MKYFLKEKYGLFIIQNQHHERWSPHPHSWYWPASKSSFFHVYGHYKDANIYMYIYIYIYIKCTVFVYVTTKSAQHAHERMIAIIVEKSPNAGHLYEHGFMDTTNHQAVKNLLNPQTSDTSLTPRRLRDEITYPFLNVNGAIYSICINNKNQGLLTPKIYAHSQKRFNRKSPACHGTWN